MVTTDVKDNTGNMNRFPETPPPLAAALKEQIPQIESGFHFLYLYGKRSIGTEEITFKEEGIAASPEFLEVFNFPLISGRGSDLADPNSIFLSQRLTDKIFPEGSPVGKELLYKDDRVLIVKGVFKDVPRNSSLQFDFLIPYEIEYGISEEWWQLSDATFIRMSPSADMEEVYNLMKSVWREKLTDDQYNIGIISITDLRYGADFEFFNVEHGHGSRKKLYMFMGVALLILILGFGHPPFEAGTSPVRKSDGSRNRSVLFLFMHCIWSDHFNNHCGSGLGILSCFKGRLWSVDSFKRNKQTELQVSEESKERFCYESVCSLHCTIHLKPYYHQTGRFYDEI
jgi:hypothetical protein